MFLFLGQFMKKLPINFSFIFVFFWFFLTNKIYEFLIFLIVLIIHELGHYIIAKKRGYKLTKFNISMFGAELNYEKLYSVNDELIIALSGPIFNIFSAFLMFSLWWIFPGIYVYTKTFCFFSLCLGLFNLLPAYPLDGGRVLISALSLKYDEKNALKLIKYNNLFLSLIFFIFFIISCFFEFNLTFILMIIFLFSGFFEAENRGKYQLMSLIKEKNKNFTNIKFIYVGNGDISLLELIKKIENNKFIFFYFNYGKKGKLIPENIIINLSLKNNLNEKIKYLIN